jgi:nucleoside-triphosphatase THEP1
MVTPHTIAKRWIITGERGVGKTTFCRRLMEGAGAAGWDVAGLISLPRYEGEVKTGIQIL